MGRADLCINSVYTAAIVPPSMSSTGNTLTLREAVPGDWIRSIRRDAAVRPMSSLLWRMVVSRGDDPGPLLLGNERILFPSFRAAIDRAKQRDQEMSKKRSEWGKLGSQAKKDKAAQGSPENDQPNKHYNNNNNNQNNNNNNNNNNNDNEGVTADVRPVGPVERAKRIGNETIL